MNQNRVTEVLQAALSATTNGVLITDNTLPDNPIIYVNPGFESMTGYETGEIIGRNCRFLQGPDTPPEDVAQLRAAVRGGRALQLELLNYKKDGTPFWNDLSISPVKDGEGRVTHFIGVQSDVTSRKEVEKAQRAQLMAENVVDTVRESLVILNEDLTVHSVNQSFYRIFQTSPDETIGQHLYQLQGGYLNIPSLKTLLESILPRQNPFEDFEITHDFPGLGTKTLVLNARRLERQMERPEFILLAIEDVTPWKESETALYESERRSRFIVEGLRDVAVITTNAMGRITTWNPGAQKIIGYGDEEITGQSLSVLFDAEDIEKGVFEAEMRAALEHGQAREDRWLVRKDGSRFYAMGILTALHDEAGHFQGYAKLIHDQTERKLLEEELEKRARELAIRDRSKDEFLAMLGHELRNPLAAISNSVNVAQMIGTQESLKRPLEIANRQVDHMNRLVGDLLDVARVTQGKITLQNERVALDEIVGAVTRSLGRNAQAKGLELHLDITSGVWVEGDPLRLEQIVSNLVTNAIKYTAHGQVEVRLEKQGERALLSVRDTGAGIEAELLPRLFDLFSQADRSLARSEGGLGVGLTIVKQLVELHGGSIAVESAGAERGSTFRVSLPLSESEAEVSEAEPLKAQSGDKRFKVLVVEDNQDIAEMTVLTLQLWNYRTSLASNGETALEMAQSERPHLVLLDIGLPGLDGYAVARRLREKFSPQTMKLVSLTGYAQEEDAQRAREAGFDQHLAKPVNFATLRELLIGYEAELAATRLG